MQYIYSIDSGSNVYAWKWVEENISEAYLNFRASKIRQRNNIRNAGKKNVKIEPNT